MWRAAMYGADETMEKPRNLTIKDVANYLGVGVGTVSRAINNADDISIKTKERVFKAIRDLGYTPNRVAQSMRTNRYKNVAFIMDISNISFVQIAKGISEYLDDMGYSLTLYNVGNRDAKDKILSFAAENRCDGIILSLPHENDSEITDIIGSLNIPVVTLGRDIEAVPSGIVTDYYGAAKKASEYLLSLGHRGIALLTGANKTRPVRECIQAFHKAYEAYGLSSESSLVVGGEVTIGFGQQAMLELLPKIRDASITAVFTLNIQMFQGVLRVMRDHDLNYPEDVSLITFEDSELTQLLKPAVTAIRSPLYEMGLSVAQAMINQIEERATYRDSTFMPIQNQLIIRDSCKRLA